MALLTLREVSVSFGSLPLLEKISLEIEKGERVCLLGRNGTGKTTLLKLMNGDLNPDKGEVVRQQGLCLARIPQEVPQGLSGTIFDLVVEAWLAKNESPTKYHQLNSRSNKEAGSELSGQPDIVQKTLDSENGWQINQRVEKVLSLMQLSRNTPFEVLSAGLKRRVMLARALVLDPDILLLDEPTNHLDIQSIIWLEDFLLEYGGTLVFVTHDRMFLKKLATRIVELDRGKITSWSCNYEIFLKRRQALLDAELEQWVEFDKKLSREEVWFRQGIKARRTRNEGRVRALEQLRETQRMRRKLTGSIRFQRQEAERSGKLVILAEDVCFSYDDQQVIRNFSTTIMRGDKVGIIGPNGCGKTTLLLILLGELTPQRGKLSHGTKLEAAYFDQLRMQLDEGKSVMENVANGADTITINGRSRHIVGYLQDFLFSRERCHAPIQALSGGERNRLLLARLLAKPSNILVMDEPTNDLDVETLEVVENLLQDYQGTLLLVSHDRTLLNNIVTSTLVFESQGIVQEYIGGFDDWLRQRKQIALPSKERVPVRAERKHAQTLRPPKLSYKEQQELEALPNQIENLERELRRMYQTMADPAFYQQESNKIAQAKTRLEAIRRELDEAYKRWETLEDIQKGNS